MEKETVKKKKDMGKIAKRVMAGLLVFLMVAGTFGTSIYYLVNYVIKK